MPLDFGREWFYNSRREQIETRLKWIRNSTNEVSRYMYCMRMCGLCCCFSTFNFRIMLS